MKKRKEKEFKIRTYLDRHYLAGIGLFDDNFSITFCVFKAFSGNAGKYSCDCLAVDF